MFVGGACDILGYVNGSTGWIMDATANGWAWIIIGRSSLDAGLLTESPAVMGILVCLLDAMVFFVTFMKLGVMSGAGVTAVTAYVALAACIFAMYMATGVVLNNAFGKTILPLGEPIIK